MSHFSSNNALRGLRHAIAPCQYNLPVLQVLPHLLYSNGQCPVTHTIIHHWWRAHSGEQVYVKSHQSPPIAFSETISWIFREISVYISVLSIDKLASNSILTYSALLIKFQKAKSLCVCACVCVCCTLVYLAALQLLFKSQIFSKYWLLIESVNHTLVLCLVTGQRGSQLRPGSPRKTAGHPDMDFLQEHQHPGTNPRLIHARLAFCPSQTDKDRASRGLKVKLMTTMSA